MATKENKWALSSVGRASALQAGGHRFEPCSAHHIYFGPVVQLVRTLACHARGRGFESLPGRHFFIGQIAQSVEQRTENPRVGGSIPSLATIILCGSSSVDRASPCQGEGRGFEPRLPLQKRINILTLEFVLSVFIF